MVSHRIRFRSGGNYSSQLPNMTVFVTCSIYIVNESWRANLKDAIIVKPFLFLNGTRYIYNTSILSNGKNEATGEQSLLTTFKFQDVAFMDCAHGGSDNF